MTSQSSLVPFRPALLCDATWYGTLAAVRDLGSRGVPVTLASETAFAPARWSRYVANHVRCPPTKHPDFLGWLIDFGDRHPGHVLYPTSDDLAWLIVCNVDALRSRFALYAPPLEALRSLLDKGRVAKVAQAAGVATPETWTPSSIAEVEEIARVARFPVIVKPRTQLENLVSRKGNRVDRGEDLPRVWREVAGRAADQRPVGADSPALPLVQTCCDAEMIFTVDGFVDAGGEMVVLGCNKLLQVPRRKGPGVIFEDATVPPDIAAALRRLWLHVGFVGVFDVEFANDAGRWLLIDVNPRFYNHMAFEIDRGLPLPWLAYLAAVGETDELHAAMRAVPTQSPLARRLYVHRLPTALMLAMQRLAGNMTSAQVRAWRARIADHSGAITDPALDWRDVWPAAVEVAFHVEQLARHPRAFLRQFSSGAPSGALAGRDDASGARASAAPSSGAAVDG